MAMEQNVVVVNLGSASKKYAWYQGSTPGLTAHFEVVDGGFVVTLDGKTEAISASEYEQAFSYVAARIEMASASKVLARVVAPGMYFAEHRIIDDTFIEVLKQQERFAPLHITPLLSELGYIRAHTTVPLWGISDSAFHQTLASGAYTYAIPRKDAEEFGIRRYGYHGISVQGVVRGIEEAVGSIPARAIVCHLGGGASITALRDGKSIETSMGFSPLEGLVMATRSGDLDVGAAIALAKARGYSLDELEQTLMHRGGLLGISETSDDIRELLKQESAGNASAALALEVYVRRIVKYIGAYATLLGGLDLLVFTGTVGERSFVMRERIVGMLGAWGPELSISNQSLSEDEGGVVSAPTSRVLVRVIRAREADEMVRIARDLE